MTFKQLMIGLIILFALLFLGAYVASLFVEPPIPKEIPMNCVVEGIKTTCYPVRNK